MSEVPWVDLIRAEIPCDAQEFRYPKGEFRYISTLIQVVETDGVKPRRQGKVKRRAVMMKNADANPHPVSCGIDLPTKASDVPSVRDVAVDRYAIVNNICLHYVEGGPENKRGIVVLIHGVPQFWYTWRKVIPSLVEAGYRVIAPDLRGFNISGRTSKLEDYSLQNYAKDISELIALLKKEEPSLTPKDFTVVGHDLGSFISWYVGINHSQEIGRILITNGPQPALWRDTVVRNVDKEQYAMSWYAFAFAGMPHLADLAMSGLHGLTKKIGIDGIEANLNYHMRTSPLTAVLDSSMITPEDIYFYKLAVNDNLASMTMPYQAMLLPDGILASNNWHFLDAVKSTLSFGIKSATPGTVKHAADIGKSHPSEPALLLEKVKVPLRLIYGMRDGYLKYEIFASRELLLKYIDPSVQNQFRVTSVADGSHWIPEEKPAEVFTEIDNLIKDT
jgi:pimeloyl-ACP methyl ester carboxylesterase